MRGRRIDERSDLFAFAAVSYELITSRSPYGESYDLWTLLRRYVDWRAPALPDDVPADLCALIGGLLQRKASERKPQSARQARTGLAGFDESAVREQLASMVRAVCERPQKAPASLCIGQVIEADAMLGADMDVAADAAVDARADTEPERMRAVDSQARTEERPREDSGAPGQTRPGAHGQRQRRRRRRIVATWAAAGLLGLLAAGGYAIDRGRAWQTASRAVVTDLVQRSSDRPGERAADRVIGPNRLATTPSRTQANSTQTSAEDAARKTASEQEESEPSTPRVARAAAAKRKRQTREPMEPTLTASPPKAASEPPRPLQRKIHRFPDLENPALPDL